MTLRLRILLFSLIFSCSFGYSQTDSSDLNFYSTPVQLLTLHDSLMYYDGNFRELKLEFSLSDPENFGKVYIELGIEGSSTVLYRRKFTLAELNSQNLLDGNNVILSLGIFGLESNYLVSVTVEQLNQTLSSTLVKNLAQ